MSKIFISYRREDSKHAVGRLHSALKQHIRDPQHNIFIDIDSIPKGVDFVEHLESQVAQCDVMLVVIGLQWLEARDPTTGNRRLESSADFVRIEVASALARDILVVPVVLDEARIPAAELLPPDLQALARRNGERLRHESFDADVARLVRGLSPTIRTDIRDAAKQKSFEDPLDSEPPASDPDYNDFLSGFDPFAPVPPQELKAPAPSSSLELNFLRRAARLTRVPPAPASEPDSKDFPSPIQRLRARLPHNKTWSEFQDKLSDGSLGPTMVPIPRGSFASDNFRRVTTHRSFERKSPTNLIEIDYDFAVGKYPVTWNEWSRCVADGACGPVPDDGFGKKSRPVTNVSFQHAKRYVAWLSTKTGCPYRLLNEAEWEYAARAGGSSDYAFGNTITRSQANFRDGPGKTTPVGDYPANGFGLCDMHGNVWEWVDDFDPPLYPKEKPRELRVLRGGSWKNHAPDLRCTSRHEEPANTSSNARGFRIARSL